MLNQKFKVLDDGFVILKAVMGDDAWIDQCARHAEESREIEQVWRLINYMMKNRHTSPFEFAELCFHVRVPMDCWRQWVRHRTANINEYSTRYAEAISSCQATNYKKWRKQSDSNRQGSSGEYLNTYEGQYLSRKEMDFQRLAIDIYKERIRMGVAKEQARKDLPLSTYTEAYWKIDLHNLFHFLQLRADEHAQEEIREYAYAIGAIVQRLFPISFEAWREHVWQREWHHYLGDVTDETGKVCWNLPNLRESVSSN